MLIMSGINLCPALGSEITSADKKAIIADNAALLVENRTLRESLIVERNKSNELIGQYQEIVSTDKAIIDTKDVQIQTLKDIDTAKEKKYKKEKTKDVIVGTVIGIVVGLLIK
jgi:hypothetical protein